MRKRNNASDVVVDSFYSFGTMPLHQDKYISRARNNALLAVVVADGTFRRILRYIIHACEYCVSKRGKVEKEKGETEYRCVRDERQWEIPSGNLISFGKFGPFVDKLSAPVYHNPPPHRPLGPYPFLATLPIRVIRTRPYSLYIRYTAARTIARLLYI